MTLRAYLEVSRRRTFAAAAEWPGWCRAGRTEGEALETLVAYGPRYRDALGVGAGAALILPSGAAEIEVVERLAGNATTDFGAPGVIPDLDRMPASDSELERLMRLLTAAWATFDRSAAAAETRTLAPSGPRGGGRALAKMVEHVVDADRAYVRAVGGSAKDGSDWKTVQHAFVEACMARAHGELSDRGPRGGERWPAPYAIRRSAWHALDHAWEIEDRLGR